MPSRRLRCANYRGFLCTKGPKSLSTLASTSAFAMTRLIVGMSCRTSLRTKELALKHNCCLFCDRTGALRACAFDSCSH